MPSANPFSSGSWLPNLSPQIANFADNLVRLKTHSDEMDLRGRALQQGQSQFDATNKISQGNLEVSRGQLAETGRARATAEEANKLARVKLTPDQGEFTPVNESRARAALKAKTGLGASIDKIFGQYVTPFAQDNAATKGTLYDHLASQGKESVTGMLNEIQADYEKNLAKDPNYAKTQQGKEAENLMNVLYNSPDGSVLASGVMPDVARYRKEQEANTKAALLLANPPTFEKLIAEKVKSGEITPEEGSRLIHPVAPQRPASVLPGASLVDPSGNVVYTNPAKPERPVSVTPGATLVDPGTGKPVYRAPGKAGAEGKLSDVEKQELIGVRADLRTVNRELSEVRRNAGYGMEAAKSRLPLIESEYNELKAREKELLSKDSGGAGTATPPAAKPKADTDALMREANQAIANGADPVEVKKRLKDQYGVEVK